MTSGLRYAGRLVLPLLLLAAAVGAWTISDRMGSVTHSEESTAELLDPSPEVAAPVLSVRRLPEFAVGSSVDAAIALAVDSLPADPGGLSCAAVLVNGSPVLSLRADQALAPAYAQLLITGHAAIDVLGPEFRYETRALASSLPDDNGRIAGGLYLIGGGDPVLMSQRYALGFQPPLTTRTAFEKLAAALAEAGVVRIDGGVIGVGRRYDDEQWLPGWPDDLTQSGLVGPLTSLQLDDGFEVRPEANLGVAVPAAQPVAQAATRLATELALLDIAVSGTHRSAGPEEELPSLIRVVSISSPPLADIVFQMLAVNDASAAELIIKELGFATTSVGSSQAGGLAVQRVLQNQGLDLAVPFRSGSGLDPIGGTSCNQLAAAADNIPADHPTLDVLPDYYLPGVFDGLLGEVEILSDLRVVGGIEGDSSGLVGRTVDGGVQVTIASIINRPGGPTPADLAFQEALVELVDELRLSISFTDVEPDS